MGENKGKILANNHYSPKDINDNFSKVIFKKYLADVDGEKDVFIQADIDALAGKYETKIDDELLGKTTVQFVPAVVEVLKKRTQETEAIYKDLLSRPFDFTKDESINLDFDKVDFPKNDDARKEAWRKRLKYLTLERYNDLIELQEADKSKPGFVAKTNTELEKEARERTLKIMNRYYDRLNTKGNNTDERFNLFVETIVQYMDPHSSYFPPVEKRYFDEQMSGRFFGIGALLKEEANTIKFATLTTGSPAWKSGQINVGDVILKVGQGNQEPVDITGFFVEDAVKLIRGTKGTDVKLTIKKTDGSIKTVTLTRDEIVQDETFARSAIVNNSKGKIGYIYLPEFYADFKNPKGNRCSIDVAKEVVKLKEQKVDGIVIDLRYNPGGSLYDVVQMVGLFVDQGAVVQVKDREGKAQVLRDNDIPVLYDGPLAVMVNEYSASASEIFAAAIQDYKRGVIIGSTSTYGKGTVQRPVSVDNSVSFMAAPDDDLGTVQLTLQKFYRINGGSTQLRGVSSDVVLPDGFEYSKIREKDNPDALPYDEIKKADYTPWKYAYDLTAIKNASSERLKNNSPFATINTGAAWLNKHFDKLYPLSLEKYREEQKQVKATVKQIEKVSKLTEGMNITSLPEDSGKYSTADKVKSDRYAQWLKNLKTDIYLDEAVKVVNDMASQKNVAYKK